MIDYNQLLEAELQGVYGDYLQKVSQIIKWYEIYDGEQEWDTATGLDYEPTRKVTNIIKKLIDTQARLYVRQDAYFDIRPVQADAKGSTTYQDQARKKGPCWSRF